MTQSETSYANRRRRELHAAFDALAEDAAQAIADLRAALPRSFKIADGRPSAPLGQMAVDIALEADETINSSRRLWDELLDLKRAALGGRETP